MKRLLIALTSVSVVLGGLAFAQTPCETRAVDKNGRPLVGAAKNSFLQKCRRESCLPKAVGKDGRPLTGAAKNSFMQACERTALSDRIRVALFDRLEVLGH